MKAEAEGSWPELSVTSRRGAWRRVIATIRRIPRRLRERRFWHVQSLVFVAMAPHYTIEITGFNGPLEGHEIHYLAITLFIVPLLYAAINYSWEGAVLTALWLAALTAPSIFIWHASGFHWLALTGQLLVILPLGVLAAWRVDSEAKQRRRAEETSASLALLNEIGESLRHTLEVEQQIPQVLHHLLSGLSLRSAWLCLEPETDDSTPITIVEVSPGQPPATAKARELHQHLRSQGSSLAEHAIMENNIVAISLTGETRIIGSLGVAAGEGEALTEEQVDLLTTVAHQVRVALENARLSRQRQESLRSYAQQVTQGQEEERLRIARELHDETAQELVHLVRKLELLRDGLASDMKQPVDELLAQTRSTLQSVRRFSRDLRPSVLDDLGLLAAIEIVVEETNGRLPQGAQLQIAGRPRRLDQPLELALFRIAQEALRNVEKHAEASSATVELAFGPEEIKLSVTDDGRGFTPAPNISDLPQTGKLGLLGMKERAELVGGRFELYARPGEGTRLIVEVTLDVDAAVKAAKMGSLTTQDSEVNLPQSRDGTADNLPALPIDRNQ